MDTMMAAGLALRAWLGDEDDAAAWARWDAAFTAAMERLGVVAEAWPHVRRGMVTGCVARLAEEAAA